ncbi:Fungal specific transcription factor domain-containing protein [Cladophialophora immunda]|nr:Fungal specific transcription factor domain-containing protein [Cladophialophora immunda]
MSDDSSEGEWVDVDGEYDELIATTAGEIAEVGQQCIPQPGGLRKAFLLIGNSTNLFNLSTFIKAATVEEQSEAISEMKHVVAETLGWEGTSHNEAQGLRNFSRQMTSDPACPSSQTAIQNIADYLSLHNTSSQHVSQPLEDLSKRRWAKRFDLEEYSKPVTTALHDTFYKTAYLPCTCARIDESYRWIPIQFQLPRRTKERTREDLPPGPPDIENETSKRQDSLGVLNDFCTILGWNITCFRIYITKTGTTQHFCHGVEEVFSTIFPEKGRPLFLSTALKEGKLSARHKIFLAFIISKAFWQYYDSDWMNVEWSVETIQLLQTSNPESETPFLKIKSTTSDGLMKRKLESQNTSEGIPQLHRYPYILNLGLLLVQLGSITPETTIFAEMTTNSTGAENNDICVSCCTKISEDNVWPTIEIPAKHKLRYRHIVEECLPTPSEIPKALFDVQLDAAGRRAALRDYVVRPLFELFQDMSNPDTKEFQPPRVTLSHRLPVLQAEDVANKASKNPSDLAWDWLNNITHSWLHNHISSQITKFKRPKIAIIDTGFDGQARFVDRKLMLRLNMVPTAEMKYNWKDFWECEVEPQDNDGHGTSMLSLLHRMAPFADVCVARIAGKDEDMRRDPEKTSDKLAKAILWAVEEQEADIVSLSLGWEQEQQVDRHRVISNAISHALSHRNQNLLIFAAASNRGGSKRELFPAKHPTIFSIRGTNTRGEHEEFNPSLPKRGEKVFGTLGLEVPASNRGRSKPHYSHRSGTSVATAIAAGFAAIIIGYINIHDNEGRWDNIRMYEGFQNLLYKLSTEPEARKRFISLDNHSKEEPGRQDHRSISTAMVPDILPKSAYACVTCHNRKVRCVIDGDGPSCRACRNANIECIPRSRKKRKCSTVASTAQNHRRTSRSPPSPADVSRIERAAAPQPSNFSHSVRILVDQSTTHTPIAYTAVADEPLNQRSGLQTATPPRWTQSGPEAFFSWTAPLPARHVTSNGELDQPFNPLATESQVPSYGFEVPPRSVRQDLTNGFLEYCNPWLPIVEHADLANLARIEQQSASMLLAQALWFAASCIDPSSTAPSQFYQRARALFWSGGETDPFVAVKAALMLMSHDWQGPGHVTFDSSELWLHVAVTMAYRIKLHRDPPPGSKSGIRRRLWWTIVAQDSLMSLLYARPRAVNLMDSDVRALDDVDFVDSQADPAAFSLYMDICKVLGDLVECYRRGFMSNVHRSSLENSLHLWRLRLCQYESVDADRDISQATDQSLVFRQLKLPYLTALVLFSKSQRTPSTLKCSSASNLRISATASIAASLSAGIFKSILEHDEIQYLGPVFTIYAYSASMALLRLWAYPKLWQAAQPDLQTLREALLSLARHDSEMADAAKALDNAVESLKTTRQHRPADLPRVSDQALCLKLLETMSPAGCQLWSHIAELVDDSRSMGAERTLNSLAGGEARAENATVSQSQRADCFPDCLLSSHEFAYHQFEDWILHDG